jgi:hypothetical protein
MLPLIHFLSSIAALFLACLLLSCIRWTNTSLSDIIQNMSHTQDGSPAAAPLYHYAYSTVPGIRRGKSLAELGVGGVHIPSQGEEQLLDPSQCRYLGVGRKQSGSCYYAASDGGGVSEKAAGQ